MPHSIQGCPDMVVDIERMFVNEAPDAPVAITPAGEIIFWNKSASEIFGFSAEEVKGKSLLELTVPVKLIEEAKQAIQQVMKTGFVVYESFRNRRDGSQLHVNISAKAVRDSHGNVEFIAVSKKDITHLRVLREASLVESQFGKFLESTPDAIVIVNGTGHIVLINTHGEKLFGHDRSELIGQNVEMLLPKKYRGTKPIDTHEFIRVVTTMGSKE